MDKYTELEKQAQKFLDETDTMQFSMVELLTMFYNHQEQLRIGLVVGQSEQLSNFCKEISKQENCPQEFQDIVNKEFWNLIG